MALRFVFNGQNQLLDFLDPENVTPDVLRDQYLLASYPDLRDAGFRVYKDAEGVTVYEYSRTNGDKG